MSDKKENLELLSKLCGDVEIWSEGGEDLVYLPNLKFNSDGNTCQMDALLCPRKYGGYETRLFLQKPLPSKGSNWNTFNICGKTWHACSFNGVSANLPWIEILGQHLRILA